MFTKEFAVIKKTKREDYCKNISQLDDEMFRMRNRITMAHNVRSQAKKTLRSIQNLSWNSGKPEYLKPIISEASLTYEKTIFILYTLNKEMKRLKNRVKYYQRQIDMIDY